MHRLDRRGQIGLSQVLLQIGLDGPADRCHRNVVNRVVINDLDSSIHAFWIAAVHHSRDLLAVFDETPLTLDEWQAMTALPSSSAAFAPRPTKPNPGSGRQVAPRR